MLKSTFVLLFATMITNSFAQSNKDSLAIVNLLEKEAATWRIGDKKGHADCWAVRPYSRILISTTDARVIDLDPQIMLTPPDQLIGNGGKAILSNFKIGITGNSAWVSHNEESISKEGGSTFSYEVRLLEKVNGAWKLVGQSVHQYKK
ncbi:MAG TPA: endo-arabinase [Runella sp.]|nr:endo-arabinase [Runella sp.]